MYSIQGNRLIYIVILLGFIAAFGLSASAQPVTDNLDTYSAYSASPAAISYILKGSLTGEDNSPIRGASIVIMPGGHQIISDANGMFRLRLKGTSNYTLTANALGYHPISVTIDIPEDMTSDTVIEKSWQMSEDAGNLSDV